MAEDEGSRWRTREPAIRDSPIQDCPYCTEDHSQERGEIALMSAVRGHLIRVVTDNGDWLVPREFVRLHKFRAADLPLLADLFGWSKID